MGKTIAILFAMVLCTRVRGQEITKQVFLGMLSKVQEQMRKDSSVSFDVLYYFSGARSPRTRIDSVKGHVDIAGQKYHSILAETETIQVPGLSIILFGEDKLMYLARPQTGNPQQTATNPLAMLDSMYYQMGAEKFEEKAGVKETVYTVHFKDGSPILRISFSVNKAAGFVRKSEIVVKTASVLDGAMQKDAGGKPYEAYSTIETLFSNYRSNSVDSRIFDASRYFIKENNTLKVTPAYSNYTIYKGTLNL